MKRHAWMALTIVSLLVLLGASAASAGSVELRADIPFNFMAGNNMLPAGTYHVSQAVASHGVLLISNQKPDHGATFVQTISSEKGRTQTETRLIFNRYGDRYFLSQVWTAGRISGYMIPKSSQERELARELAAMGTRGLEVVSIVASVK